MAKEVPLQQHSPAAEKPVAPPDWPSLRVVLVSTDGHARFLPDCLRSLAKACEGLPCRAVLVDVNGRGRSTKLAETLHVSLPVEILSQPRVKGFAENVNDALADADEEYFLLLNVDTQIPGDALRRALRRMEQDRTAGALTCRMRGADGKLQASGRAFPVPLRLLWEQTGLARIFPRSRWFGQLRLHSASSPTAVEVDWASGAFLLVRAEAWRQVGGMDSGYFLYSEDMDLGYRLRRAGWRVVLDPGIEIFHLKDPLRGENRRWAFVQTHRSLLRFWKLHGSRRQQAGVRAVLLLGILLRFLSSPLLLRRGTGYWRKSLAAYRDVLWLLLGREPQDRAGEET